MSRIRFTTRHVGYLGLLIVAAGFLLGMHDFSQAFVEVAREQPISAPRFGLLPGTITLVGLVLVAVAIVAAIVRRILRKPPAPQS
jgi:hypothetical protein